MTLTIEEIAPGQAGPSALDGGVAPIDPQELVRHAPARHAWVRTDAGVALARCSWWSSETPSLPNHRVGVIGHFASTRADAAVRLLDHACARLAEGGRTIAVGPMDGNTWRKYRLVTDRGIEPPFFLEPENPVEWPRQFLTAGFSILASYSSALNDDLSRPTDDIEGIETRLAREGIRVRTLNGANPSTELSRIFELSRAGFAHNFLYTPIAEAEFLEQYRQILPFVRPELVYLAEQGGRLIGFLFTMPDLLEARRRGAATTIILKSIAVAPELAGRGLGRLLMAKAQRDAGALGFRRAIHALMHDTNISRRISQHSAQTMRRYGLFARGLWKGNRP